MKYKKLMKKLYHNLINQIKKDFKKLEKKYPKLIGLLYILIGLCLFVIPCLIITIAILWLISILT